MGYGYVSPEKQGIFLQNWMITDNNWDVSENKF